MTKKSQKQAQPEPVQESTITFDNLSLDMGNAYTNIRADNGLAVDFRSIVAPLSLANRIGERYIEDEIFIDGAWWAVGDRAYTLAPDAIQEHPTVNRYVSPWYKRLFAFALHKAFYKRVGDGIVYPRVISSVPAELFKNVAEMDAVKANLAGDYDIGNVYGGSLIASVLPRQIVLIPEGIGAYFGLVFGPGNNAQYQQGTWLIADVGYLTLDAVFVRDGEYMPDMARSDEKTGVSVVANQIRDLVFSKAHVRLARTQIDEALQCDTIEVNRKALNIGETRSNAFEQLGKRASLLLEEWAAGQNLSGILMVGGGALFLHPHIDTRTLPPVVLPANPRRANVEGAYAYLTSED